LKKRCVNRRSSNALRRKEVGNGLKLNEGQAHIPSAYMSETCLRQIREMKFGQKSRSKRNEMYDTKKRAVSQ